VKAALAVSDAILFEDDRVDHLESLADRPPLDRRRRHRRHGRAHRHARRPPRLDLIDRGSGQ
jgi:hypothetical protein